MKMGMFFFSLKVKKGKAIIGKCKVEADITGSGSEPLPIIPPTGSGSGPLPTTGSGSEPVLPIVPGSGPVMSIHLSIVSLSLFFTGKLYEGEDYFGEEKLHMLLQFGEGWQQM